MIDVPRETFSKDFVLLSEHESGPSRLFGMFLSRMQKHTTVQQASCQRKLTFSVWKTRIQRKENRQIDRNEKSGIAISGYQWCPLQKTSCIESMTNPP
jgi:hypothetical protein